MDARFEVVGRDDELEAMRGFVGSLRAGAAVLEGEPGIGKTTLWQEAIASAGSLGHTVLTARASTSETAMGFTALSDLLSEHMDDVIDQLPGPQATALEIALLRRADSGGGSADARAISAGCLGVLRALAERVPVLVAVDDLQWIDRETASALGFAFRRLDGEPVHLSATLRSGVVSPGTTLIDAFPPDRVDRIQLGPLSLQALHVVIFQHAGLTLARPVLRRIAQISGGNPFFALELARTIAASGEERSAISLRLSPRLEDLVRARLNRLATRALRVLEPAALVAAPTLPLVRALAADPEHVDADLERAVAAGIVSVQDEEVHFTHPTLAEGLAGMMGPLRRRALHARLAASIDDLEERARHLAAATTTPDADVARLVEDGAQAAATRGATASQAELMEFAARLTPDDEIGERWRRLTAAAAAFELIGLLARARALIDESLSGAISGAAKADALVVRATIRWDDFDVAEEALEEAALEAGDDARRLSVIMCQRAPIHMIRTCNIPEALVFAGVAADAATRTGDDMLLIPARALVSFLENFAGRITEGLLESAIDLEERASAPYVYWESPACVLGFRLFLKDRLVEARELFERDIRRAEDSGRYVWAETTTTFLAELELRAGNFEEAGRLADESWTNRQQRGEEVQGGAAFLYRRAAVLVHLGPLAEARTAIARGIEISAGACDALFHMRNLALLGFLELSLGNASRADEVLRPIPHWLIEHGWDEPSYFPVWPNAIEALVGVGELGLAIEYLDLFDERARRCECPWALASARRCEGLVRAAQGNMEGALESFDQALHGHDGVPSRFERGRTLLCHGVVLRRAMHRREARSALDEALKIFTDASTPAWSERVRAELARIGGRVVADGLTATERQVAGLVAQGRTNREVAAEVFLTVRSVESNLSKIYAKLGVRSRAELAARFARSD